MADNTTLNPGKDGDVIASDELLTVNGATAQSGLKVQRVKVGYGSDGELQDVERHNGLPVVAQALDVLRRIASLLKPLQQVSGNGSNRLSVDVNSVASGTINTVTTVSNVATVTTISNVWAFDQAKAISRQAFNGGIRSRIS
jgi:PII-like signaling protein